MMTQDSPRALNLSVSEIFEPDGPLGRAFKHYRPRQGQILMAKAVNQAIASHGFLIAEAGTGTGKTFAYLIPALLAGRKVVISTGSKALQDQLIENDIPKLLKLLKLPLSYMVLKGFNNYLCLQKLDELKQELKGGLNFGDLGRRIPRTVLSKLENLAADARYELESGAEHCTFGEINSKLSSQIASLVSCKSVQCLRRNCPHYDECLVLAARKKASQSHIVVINHALFFASLDVEDPLRQRPRIMLPAYDVLIFDEAHTLPEVGRKHYSQQVSRKESEELAADIRSAVKDLNIGADKLFSSLCTDLNGAVLALFDYLNPKIGRFAVKEFKYLPQPDAAGELKLNHDFRDKVAALYQALTKIAKHLDKNKETDPERLGKLLQRALDQRQVIAAVMTSDQADKEHNHQQAEQVRRHTAWIEVSKRNYALTIAPLDIGPEFGQDLKNMLSLNCGIVMTSATLSVAQNFNKFIYDIGAADLQPKTMIVPSVFDYAGHALLYTSGRFPPANDPGRIKKLIDELRPAIQACPGGIFFLTTSYKAVQEAEISLKALCAGKRRILSQNGAMSNAVMMNEFKQDGRAILIGTASFWEGVDVPGKALSMVIIDKLPFAAPDDPLGQARAEQCERRGGKPFFDISLPEAVIALRQGVGRLIRQESDLGVMIIADPRLHTRSYGRIFLQSLPPMRNCAKLSEIINFFNSWKTVKK